jgi:hypothetical protein
MLFIELIMHTPGWLIEESSNSSLLLYSRRQAS